MNSRDALRLFHANVVLGAQLFRSEWPIQIWLLGYLVPDVLRTLVYVLIGYVVGGVDGLRFALVGCSVLVAASTTVSHMSDVPVTDVQSGTYGAVSLAGLPPVVQYFARGIPLLGVALVVSVINVSVLGVLTGQLQLTSFVLSHLWILVPPLLSGTAFGLLVIAPAIGSGYEGISYNGATALITVLSGAVYELNNRAADAVGRVLPLSHAISALRLAQDGRPYGAQLLLECLVAVAWGAVALVFYGWQDARGRRRGDGAFAA